jgi:excinuclease ABC subunit A
MLQTKIHPTQTKLAESEEVIEVLGAREHNLQNLHLEIPREKLVVITGVSGSGKSSLAFDTIYAEGQRRYLETYSSYIRQFIGGAERPDVDKINGLSPVIAIDQKTTSKNPRSTVGTITEIYDFLRLLFARAGEAYSYETGRRMEKLSDDEILRRIMEKFDGQSVLFLAPIIKGRKGHYREDLEKLRKMGYTKARIDGEVQDLVPKMSLDRFKVHDIELVVDKITVGEPALARLSLSLRNSLNLGHGSMLIYQPQQDDLTWYCRNLMDPESGISYDEPAPNSFSFNSPYGACPTCDGLGRVMEPDLNLVTNKDKTLGKAAILPLDDLEERMLMEQLRSVLRQKSIPTNVAFGQLEEDQQRWILNGDPEFEPLKVREDPGLTLMLQGTYIGIGHFLRIRYKYATSESSREWAAQYLEEMPCPSCGGARLKKESLWFRIADKNIWELSRLDLAALSKWLEDVEPRLSEKQVLIASELLKEIRKRIIFLLDVGLDYLSLDREARSLSGGEAQRIRLATQIGSQLVGVLYILDEPSIGLHQRDNTRLINSLKRLRDLGNSILVVEHDKEIMLESDYIVDIGPGAGVHGGQLVGLGTVSEFLKGDSTTALFLNGKRTIPLPEKRRPTGEKWLELIGATGHNLHNVTLRIPLGVLVCVTGVSGSGKSSLVNQTLYPLLHTHSFNFPKKGLPYKAIKGLEHLDKVIEIDQKPIGRTPRSNSATYTGLFTFIRELFSELPESKIRGYLPGRFSFNVKGGRCETCKGAGLETIEMNFLPDVYVECSTCRGKRYNRETLEVRFKGKSIFDVLSMTVDDAVGFFEAHPRIRLKLDALQQVGLGYLTIGQPATTLSGGEAQRMKIATELSKRDTGRTIYILDEPTTGLHFQDIDVLINVLYRLVEKGNTVLVIEHNLDVIKVADWVIDVGPEGGAAGGKIIAEGTPETIALVEASHTGRYLKMELEHMGVDLTETASRQPSPKTKRKLAARTA